MTNFFGLTASQGVPGRKDHTNGFQQIWGALSTWAGLWMFSSASNSVPAINGVVAGVTNQLFATVSGWAMTTPLSASLVIGAGTISGVSVFINSSGIYGAGTGITNLMGTNITANTITQDQLATNGMRILGTNSFPAGSDIAFGRYALTSLATGNNAAIPVGTNSFVEVSGPGAAFTINGINGSPNRDGKFLIILNQTGFNMTIAHDSGTDPTAANRIISMTGADRTTTGNGAATLIYSAAANRWILISFDP
jgi:hypothetical protein